MARRFRKIRYDEKKHVAELCELPADYADRITTRSVSLNYGGYRKRWELCYLLLWSLNKVMACWY